MPRSNIIIITIIIVIFDSGMRRTSVFRFQRLHEYLFERFLMERILRGSLAVQITERLGRHRLI